MSDYDEEEFESEEESPKGPPAAPPLPPPTQFLSNEADASNKQELYSQTLSDGEEYSNDEKMHPIARTRSESHLLDKSIEIISNELADESQDSDECTTADASSSEYGYSKLPREVLKKKIALQFVPPKFNTPPDTESNIKPSEYLKRASKTPKSSLSSSHSVSVPEKLNSKRTSLSFLLQSELKSTLRRGVSRDAIEEDVIDGVPIQIVGAQCDNDGPQGKPVEVTIPTAPPMVNEPISVNTLPMAAKSTENISSHQPIRAMLSVTAEQLQRVQLKKTESTASVHTTTILPRNPGNHFFFNFGI